MKPYCFILMPFGTKTDQYGKTVEFDEVYKRIIKPAVEEADLSPLRADEEIIGGIIHKPMFERLMLCDYAIADLTTANANVFYELGVRHGIRPHSTILIYSEGMRLPFDVSPLRAIPYKIDDEGNPIETELSKDNIKKRLNECRNPTDDSPLYQLISNIPRMDIARLKTDVFRDAVEYSKHYKNKLKEARQKGIDAIKKIEIELGNINDVNPGIVIDLFLSYRAIEEWGSMIKLYEKMHPVVKNSVLVQEQLAFAYNRMEEHNVAESILTEIIDKYGVLKSTKNPHLWVI